MVSHKQLARNIVSGRFATISVLLLLCTFERAAYGQSDSSEITYSPPPPAFEVGDLGISSAFASLNYAHLSSSGLPAVNGFGLSFGAMTTPFNASSGDGNYGPSVGMTIGYHTNDQPGNTSGENAGVTLLWNKPSVRFGPALGFQTNPSTFNYGGFGQWFLSPVIDLDVRLGEFTGSGPSGNFLGARIDFYPLTDLALRADVVNNSVSGVNQTDITASAEYLASETTPIAAMGGYTYSANPGGENIGQIFLEARLLLSGSNITTLLDRNRTGIPAPHQYKF